MHEPERPYFDWPVYGLDQRRKEALFAERLGALTRHHARHCEPYARILRGQRVAPAGPFALATVPFLPVRLFKDYTLRSVPDAEVIKVLTSSGTSSQKLSRIALDRNTAMAQTRALVLIIQQFLGKARLPMLIVDHSGVLHRQEALSARGAGILGLSRFGRDHTYALREGDMAPDLPAIRAFVERHRGERVFLFGFTFMVWKYLVQALAGSPDAPRFDDAILLHGGGWKKLQDEAVDNTVFKATLAQRFGLHHVHNFYGMVEQVGSIFMECEHGRLHAPAFSDVLIRDARDWSVLGPNRIGLVQVLSLLPTSYPGHSLLTEDRGEWVGSDDCPCGRLGRTFRVHGRVPHAELRGCSDTHAAQVAAHA